MSGVSYQVSWRFRISSLPAAVLIFNQWRVRPPLY